MGDRGRSRGRRGSMTTPATPTQLWADVGNSRFQWPLSLVEPSAASQWGPASGSLANPGISGRKGPRERRKSRPSQTRSAATRLSLERRNRTVPPPRTRLSRNHSTALLFLSIKPPGGPVQRSPGRATSPCFPRRLGESPSSAVGAHPPPAAAAARGPRKGDLRPPPACLDVPSAGTPPSQAISAPSPSTRRHPSHGSAPPLPTILGPTPTRTTTSCAF